MYGKDKHVLQKMWKYIKKYKQKSLKIPTFKEQLLSECQHKARARKAGVWFTPLRTRAWDSVRCIVSA